MRQGKTEGRSGSGRPKREAEAGGRMLFSKNGAVCPIRTRKPGSTPSLRQVLAAGGRTVLRHPFRQPVTRTHRPEPGAIAAQYDRKGASEPPCPIPVQAAGRTEPLTIPKQGAVFRSFYDTKWPAKGPKGLKRPCARDAQKTVFCSGTFAPRAGAGNRATEPPPAAERFGAGTSKGRHTNTIRRCSII